MGGVVSAVSSAISNFAPIVKMVAPFVPILAPFAPIISMVSTAIDTVKKGFPKGLVSAFVDNVLPGVAPQASNFLKSTGLTDAAKGILSGEKPKEALKTALAGQAGSMLNEKVNGVLQENVAPALKEVNAQLASATAQAVSEGKLAAATVPPELKVPANIDFAGKLAAAV